VTPTKKYSDQKDPFTEQEWAINLLIIAFAASETTASTLTVILRELVQHKGVLHRLTQEIRGTFEHESDMTIASTTDLPYLNAVINEGLRIGPPVVIGVPRVVPQGGDTVCDAWLPGGVSRLSCLHTLYLPKLMNHRHTWHSTNTPRTANPTTSATPIHSFPNAS